MKKLMVAVLAAVSMGAFAAEEKVADEKKAEAKAETELVQNEAPIFWGFANYGVYSGYQLYGALQNADPTLQGYLEGNANLNVNDWNLGYLGVGVWCNSDLTGRRTGRVNHHEDFDPCQINRRAFNEFDFNLHWGRTFWLDDDNTWGIGYRTSLVWYWYPHTGASSDHNQYTTMDWDHSLELVNPYLIPYANFVHEYHESNGNLIQFGVKKPFDAVFGVEGLSITPFIEGVWRNRNYGWCFANYGNEPDYSDKIGAGLATVKFEIDATYMFNKYIGVFAKIAYCQTVDPNLREAVPNTPDNRSIYGYENEFVWGGAGVCVNF